MIHLADFEERWVRETRDWLKNSFEDEVQANRMHVIHAPEKLYPLKEQVMRNTKYGDPPLRQWWFGALGLRSLLEVLLGGRSRIWTMPS